MTRKLVLVSLAGAFLLGCLTEGPEGPAGATGATGAGTSGPTGASPQA